MQNDCGGIDPGAHVNPGQTRLLADAIREKFHLDDDNDQDILGNLVFYIHCRQHNILLE